MDHNNKRQKEAFGFNEEDLEREEKERKQNYWRGFAVASGLWLVVSILFLSHLLNILK